MGAVEGQMVLLIVLFLFALGGLIGAIAGLVLWWLDNTDELAPKLGWGGVAVLVAAGVALWLLATQ